MKPEVLAHAARARQSRLQSTPSKTGHYAPLRSTSPKLCNDPVALLRCAARGSAAAECHLHPRGTKQRALVEPRAPPSERGAELPEVQFSRCFAVSSWHKLSRSVPRWVLPCHCARTSPGSDFQLRGFLSGLVPFATFAPRISTCPEAERAGSGSSKRIPDNFGARRTRPTRGIHPPQCRRQRRSTEGGGPAYRNPRLIAQL